MQDQAVKEKTVTPFLRGEDEQNKPSAVTREAAEGAIRTLLAYLGEDVTRPGLLDTPARVVRAWEEWCEGYRDNAADLLKTFFEDIQGYDQPVMMRNISFTSHCEHHMASMPGRAHIAYWPSSKIIGISKLARVVDVFAKRLQSQENMTREIAEALDGALAPKGVAVIIEAQHGCMTTRGAHKADADLMTQCFTGIFKTDMQQQASIIQSLTAR